MQIGCNRKSGFTKIGRHMAADMTGSNKWAC